MIKKIAGLQTNLAAKENLSPFPHLPLGSQCTVSTSSLVEEFSFCIENFRYNINNCLWLDINIMTRSYSYIIYKTYPTLES